MNTIQAEQSSNSDVLVREEGPLIRFVPVEPTIYVRAEVQIYTCYRGGGRHLVHIRCRMKFDRLSPFWF